MFFKKKERLRIAITPRFHETEIDQLVAIEKKYYKFFSNYDCDLYLIPFNNSTLESYLINLKPDGIVFAGGYRLYTDEIKKFEPRIALTDETSGLTFYEKFSKIINNILKPGGTMLIEIGFEKNKSKIEKLFKQHKYVWHKDLNQNYRVIQIFT